MPTPTPNKVRYGLKNVHYALITEGANGAITYGTPKALPGAISISFAATTARKILAADDSYYWTAESLANYTGDLNIAQITDEFRADCLGEKTDANGIKYEDNTPVTARFALLFESDGDAHKTRLSLLNCTASKPAIAGQTVNPDDGPDPSQGTETITVTAAARPDGFVKARAVPGQTATVGGTETNIYDTWFNSVYVPAPAS